MTKHKGVFEKLKARGEEVLNQVSTDLMSNPHFIKALQGALRGKERLDGAVGRALKQMNIPTRTEFKRALGRVESLEGDVAALKAQLKEAARAKEKPRKRASKPKVGAPAAAPAREARRAAE